MTCEWMGIFPFSLCIRYLFMVDYRGGPLFPFFSLFLHFCEGHQKWLSAANQLFFFSFLLPTNMASVGHGDEKQGGFPSLSFFFLPANVPMDYSTMDRLSSPLSPSRHYLTYYGVIAFLPSLHLSRGQSG